MPKSNDSLPRWVEARGPLGAWFDRNARDLPWRRKRSVYRTVVSEFMLQQTRVSTVIPYFDRWLERFPGFLELAEAEEADVLSLWQGLGYYSRARNLHRLACEIVRSGIPEDEKGWRSLPGIGPYSAAAIGSIAQGMPVAVVDGNVVRVLSRLTGDETKWKNSAQAVKANEPLANEFLERRNPGRHNEAVMELGAMICLPRSPLCTVCPVVRFCRAAAEGLTEQIPQIGKTGKVEKTVRRAWLVSGDQILMTRYPENSSRLAGLMELPKIEDLPKSLQPEKEPILRQKRGIGNESITEWIYGIPCDSAKGIPVVGTNLEWVELSRLSNRPLSGPHRRWIEKLLARQD